MAITGGSRSVPGGVHGPGPPRRRAHIRGDPRRDRRPRAPSSSLLSNVHPIGDQMHRDQMHTGDHRHAGPAVRLAFVQSTWHEEIVDRCRDSFLEEIATLGVTPSRIDLYRVPGSFEIPLHAKRLAASGRYGAIV